MPVWKGSGFGLWASHAFFIISKLPPSWTVFYWDDNVTYTSIYLEVCYELSIDMTKTDQLMVLLNMGPYVGDVINYSIFHIRMH